MNKFVRAALLSVFAVAAAPAGAQDRLLSPYQADRQFDMVNNAIADVLKMVEKYPAGPLTDGACYTIADTIGSSVHTGDPGIDLEADFFDIMPRAGGKIFNSSGKEMKVAQHFSDIAAYNTQHAQTLASPEMVTIGCYGNLADAERDRDVLNHHVAGLYRGEAIRKIRAITNLKP